MLPADDGDVAVMVNFAVPFAAPAASPLDNPTVHVNSAPLDEGSPPQFTLLTPAPAVIAVATTPVGNWSFTVADVPEVAPPPFPRLMV
jgi:hypothetical protein